VVVSGSLLAGHVIRSDSSLKN